MSAAFIALLWIVMLLLAFAVAILLYFKLKEKKKFDYHTKIKELKHDLRHKD